MKIHYKAKDSNDLLKFLLRLDSTGIRWVNGGEKPSEWLRTLYVQYISFSENDKDAIKGVERLSCGDGGRYADADEFVQFVKEDVENYRGNQSPQVDYTAWVGKEVYVSDASQRQAEIYRKNKDCTKTGVLNYFQEGKQHSFVIKDIDGFISSWEYAVLADEEVAPPLKFADKCLVWDDDDTKKIERIYLGFHKGKHLATHSIDHIVVKGGGIALFAWDNAELIPIVPKKKMTLAQIQEALGYEIELEG